MLRIMANEDFERSPHRRRGAAFLYIADSELVRYTAPVHELEVQ